MPVSVNLGLMLTAANNPLHGSDPPAAFIHRESGKVLFVRPDDAVAAQHFPAAVGNLGELRAAVAASASWLLIPKFNGPPRELAGFVREWCGDNGFRVET